jgi:Cu-processing system permease protein
VSRGLDPAALAAIARQELRVLLRSRWVLAYAAVFAVLTFGVGYFGLAVIEYAGFQSLDRTAVSLLNLVLYIVPLATLLMAVQSFRPEGGVTEQLLTEPVTAAEIVLGKLAGLAGAHALSVLVGFGLTGALIAVRVGTGGLRAYLTVVAFTLLVGLVFSALGALITLLARRSLRAYALVMVAWFVLVLLFDLVVIGLTFTVPERWANRLALGALFANPVDATRVAALLGISGRELFGPAGAVLVRALGGTGPATAWLVAALVLWIALPAAFAVGALRRQEV